MAGSHPSWPKSIRGGPIQKTIESLFRLADDPSHEASINFSDLFTKTGELVARNHVCKGHNELVKFRDGAWETFNKRRHEIKKVYVSEHPYNDIIIVGLVMFQHKNGQSVTQEFVGNFMMVEFEDHAFIQRYQAWLDSKPMADLIAEAEKTQ